MPQGASFLDAHEGNARHLPESMQPDAGPASWQDVLPVEHRGETVHQELSAD